jgi:hypothetical protein
MIPYDNYAASYYKPFNIESIWEFEYTETNNLGANAINYWVRRPTWNEPDSERDGSLTQSIGYVKLGLTSGFTTGTARGYDMLYNSSNDVRRYLICPMGYDAHPEYLTVRKYIGEPYHFVHNVPVVRLPEIYLSLAEAYAKLSNYAKASEYTGLVTQPRRKAAAEVTASTIYTIYDERRREFILEGHTYWDHFRTGRNITGRQIIESIDNSSVNFGTITGNHYRCVYPVPLSELNANPAIRDQQNPGYAAWYLAVIEEDD